MTITERIEAVEKECSGVWGQSGITDWERQRLSEWKGLPRLTPKQDAILRRVEEKAGLREPE